MKYTLCLLTSPGRDCVHDTLTSFERKVSPRPSACLTYIDGAGPLPPFLYGEMPWEAVVAKQQGGFCRATRNLWRAAAKARTEWLFWLEDDFVFERPVDLRDLALVLEHEPQVAQMALYRNPVNAEEVAAGGYINQHPEEYERRGVASTMPWFEHRHHFTTNPSLFRRTLCEHEWPDGPHCEGRFGLRYREQHPDATFGIWGVGTQWVLHTGTREGSGY